MSRQRAKNKRRRRSRAAGEPAPPAARSPDARDERRPSRLEVRDGVARPDAVWAPFPLTEIGIAAGLVIFALGFVGRAPALLLVGTGVLAVVVGELCVREHLAGFRSHSVLLAALPVTVVHLGVVYVGAVTWRGPPALALDLAVAAALAWWLQRRFVAARARASAG